MDDPRSPDMSKCSRCRKMEADIDTSWEKVRYWLFGFFHEDVKDLREEMYIKGFSDGYKKGYEHYKKNVERLVA